MTTGDLKNNLQKLERALREVRYRVDVDYKKLSHGVVEAYLPILHYVMVDYNLALSKHLAEKNMDIAGKTDSRFVDGLYKILREVLELKPPMNKSQFMSNGFGEKKVILLTEILKKVHKWVRFNAPNQPKTKGLTSHLAAPTQVVKAEQCSSVILVNERGLFPEPQQVGRTSLAHKSHSAVNHAASVTEKSSNSKHTRPVSAPYKQLTGECKEGPTAYGATPGQVERIRNQTQVRYIQALEQKNKDLEKRMSTLEAKVNELENTVWKLSQEAKTSSSSISQETVQSNMEPAIENEMEDVKEDGTDMVVNLEHLQARVTLLEMAQMANKVDTACATNTEVPKGIQISAAGDTPDLLEPSPVMSPRLDEELPASPILPYDPNFSSNNNNIKLREKAHHLYSPPILALAAGHHTPPVVEGKGPASKTSTPNDPSEFRKQTKEEQEMRILDMMTSTEKLLNMNHSTKQ